MTRITATIKPDDPEYQTEVQGVKKMAVGSVRFKLVGGPYHDSVVRLWPPWDYLKFPSHTDGRYELHPPLKQKGKWVYVWNPDAIDD